MRLAGFSAGSELGRAERTPRRPSAFQLKRTLLVRSRRVSQLSRQFHVRYRLTLDDYKVLSRVYRRLTKGRRVAIVVHAVLDALMFVAASVAAIYGEWYLATYFLALGLFLLVLQFVIVPWQRRRQFVHQRLGDYEVALAADENGFSAKTDLADGTNKWAAVRQVDDLPFHVLLWPNNRIGWIVPKRAFASPAEAAAFVALAKEKTVDQKL